MNRIYCFINILYITVYPQNLRNLNFFIFQDKGESIVISLATPLLLKQIIIIKGYKYFFNINL